MKEKNRLRVPKQFLRGLLLIFSSLFLGVAIISGVLFSFFSEMGVDVMIIIFAISTGAWGGSN